MRVVLAARLDSVGAVPATIVSSLRRYFVLFATYPDTCHKKHSLNICYTFFLFRYFSFETRSPRSFLLREPSLPPADAIVCKVFITHRSESFQMYLTLLGGFTCAGVGVVIIYILFVNALHAEMKKLILSAGQRLLQQVLMHVCCSL